MSLLFERIELLLPWQSPVANYRFPQESCQPKHIQKVDSLICRHFPVNMTWFLDLCYFDTKHLFRFQPWRNDLNPQWLHFVTAAVKKET
jgi:hypothetical protein